MDSTYTSISGVAKQAKQAWTEAFEVNFPEEYKSVKNIVLCGMGGSAYPFYIIKALFGSEIEIPFELVNGYNLPKYVDENTLVLLSSYSGSTEETLSCAKQAVEKKAKITSVTAGSKLGELLKTNNLPGYIFNPIHNPAGQPRMGVGYMVVGFISILNKLGLINIEDALSGIEWLETENIEQKAKDLAENFNEKIPLIIASEHLSGNAHILRNQFNETAKNFSTFGLIPELNHHLMEGLAHPVDNKLVALFLDSSLYTERNQKRVSLTKDVVKQNKVEVVEVSIEGENHFEQMLYALSMGGFLTYHLALIYGQDPSVIPWVDFFKEKLG